MTIVEFLRNRERRVAVTYAHTRLLWIEDGQFLVRENVQPYTFLYRGPDEHAAVAALVSEEKPPAA